MTQPPDPPDRSIPESLKRSQAAKQVHEQVRGAVELLVTGDKNGAEAALGEIDRDALIADRRRAQEAVRTAQRAPARLKVERIEAFPGLKRQVFDRDRYTCRYCGVRTVDLAVLKSLSAVFPEQIPYHSNWEDFGRHIIQWSISTSLEHHLAVAHGGTNDPENLVTNCYQCNDIKKDLSADLLGWSLRPIPTEGWQGLMEFLGELQALAPERPGIARPSPLGARRHDVEAVRPESVRPGRVVLAMAEGNSQARRYRVESVAPERIEGRDFWYGEASGQCVYSVRVKVLAGVVAVLEGSPPTKGLSRAEQPPGTHIS